MCDGLPKLASWVAVVCQPSSDISSVELRADALAVVVHRPPQYIDPESIARTLFRDQRLSFWPAVIWRCKPGPGGGGEGRFLRAESSDCSD